MASDDEIHDRLTEAGEHWRARQPAPRLVGPVERPAKAGWRSPRLWAPAAAVAGVAAVIAAVALPIALRSPGPEEISIPASRPSSTMPADTGAGVPVTGRGTLFRAGKGPILLCASVIATLDLPSSTAGCSTVQVIVTGVDKGLLVRTTTGGQAYSDPVKVEGTYKAGTLAVTRVTPTGFETPPPTTEPPVPCTAPAGGWPDGYGAGNGDINALAEYVRSHLDTYDDLWQAHPGGLGTPPSYQPPQMVYVVGTKGDVDAARAQLSKLYPGSLCVHKVSYSGKDLADIAQRLQSINSQPIEAHPDPIANKVRVSVVALNPPTMAILEDVGFDALIIDEPLLQWVD